MVLAKVAEMEAVKTIFRSIEDLEEE